MDTGELNAGGNPAMNYHPIQWEVEILLVASCQRNQDKLGLMGHLARMQTYLLYTTKVLVVVSRDVGLLELLS